MIDLSDTTTKNLEYKFSDEELKDIAGKTMRLINEIDSLDSGLKSVKAQFKSDIEAKKAELNNLRLKYQTGSEYREIVCRIERDFEHNIKRVFRVDTIELIEELALPAHERQMMIDLDGDEPESLEDETKAEVEADESELKVVDIETAVEEKEKKKEKPSTKKKKSKKKKADAAADDF